jgi:hypothetical protein
LALDNIEALAEAWVAASVAYLHPGLVLEEDIVDNLPFLFHLKKVSWSSPYIKVVIKELVFYDFCHFVRNLKIIMCTSFRSKNTCIVKRMYNNNCCKASLC